MNRIHTNYRDDGKNYCLFHNTRNNCYEIHCADITMWSFTTLRSALLKFKQLLYITD